MLGRYKYTEKEQKELLGSIGIVIDTREKDLHIKEFLEKAKIPVKVRKLHQGDYSFFIPKNDSLGIPKDLFFDKEFCIERKSSLDELANNLGKDRARLKNEFATHKGKMILMIESANYSDVVLGNYKSEYNKKSFLASIHSLSMEYDVPFIFIPDKSCAGVFVYNSCKYYFRDIIK